MSTCMDCGVIQSADNSDIRRVTQFRQRCKRCMATWTKNYEKTPKGFLVRAYRNITSRVRGIQKKGSHNYRDLPVMAKSDFYATYETDPTFLELLKNYRTSGWKPSKAPSVDRIYPWFGYVHGNIRWVTHSENSANTRSHGLKIDTGKVFFTSDIHFMHGNILRYGRGEHFGSLKEMNEGIVEAWNRAVPKDALVFDLGDISIGRTEPTLEYLSQLNGFIVHLKGNHNNLKEYGIFQEALKERQLFLDTAYLDVKINDRKIIMCHYPFVTWDQKHRGSWHLHGHCHGTLPDHGHNKIMDVGLDPSKRLVGDYRPVSFSEVEEFMVDRIDISVDHHEEFD